jgi:hypothetical protein
MALRERLQVSVKWGNRHVVETSFYRFDVSWLRETTVRELLVHILAETNANLCLDDATEIYVSVMQHVTECDSHGESRKRPYVKISATRLLDDEVYDVMQDVPTRQFDFVVRIREAAASTAGFTNAFQVLFAGSRNYVELPPPRTTEDNTADDILHNDILAWLKESEVGWSRDEVNTVGRDFITRITSAMFPITSSIMSAMRDPNNAGDILVSCTTQLPHCLDCLLKFY